MKVIFRTFCLVILALPFDMIAQNYGDIKGLVSDENGKAIPGATIHIHTLKGLTTDINGQYLFKKVPLGFHHITVMAFGMKRIEKDVELTEAITTMNFTMEEWNENLDEVDINGDRIHTFGMSRMKAVQEFGIYSGKKNEVIELDNITANKATNNARQVFSKVTGLNIWESDGAGLQLGIGGRGLNPNRTSNFNTRQNGYDISADALGYPESYYTPPIEALEKIEIVRGAASLQYGTQFGGMLNFKFKKGPKTQKIELVSRQTVGSWNFLGSFNSLGGTVAKGKLNYYAYYQHKQGDGYRQNSGFNYDNAFAAFHFMPNKRMHFNLEVTKMTYLAQQAGGLTDRLFEDDPKQSIRERNWFKIDWNLLALNYTHYFTPDFKLNIRNSGLIGRRQSLGNLERINVIDFGENRTLIDGQFANFTSEWRLINNYELFNMPSTLLFGSRFYRGETQTRQGDGNDGSGPNFTYLSPDNLENSDFNFPNSNIAVFAENLLQITPRLTVTPGVRFEYINTQASGYYKTTVRNATGEIIADNRFEESNNQSRNFIILGLGLSQKLRKNVELYGNYSQNYRAVNFTDLRVDNVNLRVDPNMKDEKGFTADLGFRWRKDEILFVEGTVFYLYYDDKISQVLRSDQPPLFTDYRWRSNIGEAQNYGLEWFSEYNIWKHCKPNSTSNWSIFANLAFIRSKYISPEEPDIDGNEVEMVPPMTVRTGMSYSSHHFSSTVQWSHVAEHFSDASNAIRTATAVEGLIPSYQVLDLSAAYSWKYLKLEVSANNLLDQAYFTRRAESYPGPGIIPADGRAYYLTLQFKI